MGWIYGRGGQICKTVMEGQERVGKGWATGLSVESWQKSHLVEVGLVARGRDGQMDDTIETGEGGLGVNGQKAWE